jgi:signal peptidase I
MSQPDYATRVPPTLPPKRRTGRVAFWVLFGLAAVLLVGSIVIPIVTITPYSTPSMSMANTILPGDEIFAASGSGIQRGDVVVLHLPVAVSGINGFFVKRVIGLPGDHVACCGGGHVTVNGKPLDESYLYPGDPPSRTTFSVRLGQGQLWVMGDHRKSSFDSQDWGPVPASDVIGRVVLVDHDFKLTALHTPSTFVTDGLAPVDTRSNVYLALAALTAVSVLALLILVITGITRFMIRRRRSSTNLPLPPAAPPSSS